MSSRAFVRTIDTFIPEIGIIMMLANLTIVFVLLNGVEPLSARAQKNVTPSHAAAVPAHASSVATTATTAAAVAPAVQSTTATTWPLHGRVTTEFGVPEPPYQPIHTGIDISSSRPSGAATITPYKEGVVKAVETKGGLGNHVIVDHGAGVTSYYAHLSVIAVHVGQAVKPGDVLGYEGHTGVATGTHLHFEIRRSNVPVNPRSFIPGSPN